MDWLSWPLLGSLSLGSLTFCLGLFKSVRLALALTVLSTGGTWLVAQAGIEQWQPGTFSSRLTSELMAVSRSN